MAFLGIFGNYNKPGPGVNKDEPPKAAPIRFFEILFRKFWKLVQTNLIFVIPTLVAAILMACLYLFPTHFVMALPNSKLEIDVWTLYVMPLPLVLLSPFIAGMTFIARNFSREEHAFIWSDFWGTVQGNWKYFLLNGVIVYFAYVILSFSMIYYYTSASTEWLFYIPFWVCIVISILLVFAQYYLPVMFITFDLKFGQAYRNAFIFAIAGLGRNVLITVVLGLLFFGISVIPIPIVILLALFLLFSLLSYFVNFTVYPIIDRYLIKPYEQRLEEEKNGSKEEKDPLEEKYSGLFSQEPEDEDDEDGDKYVYVNGKLVKRSELREGERERLPDDE